MAEKTVISSLLKTIASKQVHVEIDLKCEDVDINKILGKKDEDENEDDEEDEED